MNVRAFMETIQMQEIHTNLMLAATHRLINEISYFRLRSHKTTTTTQICIKSLQSSYHLTTCIFIFVYISR